MNEAVNAVLQYAPGGSSSVVKDTEMLWQGAGKRLSANKRSQQFIKPGLCPFWEDH